MKKSPSSRLSISTRMFPIGTAATNARWMAGFLAGSTIFGASAAFAVDWNGSASTDWNTAANWDGGVPAGSNAVINNISSNFPVISADIASTPVDIIIGNGGGTTGRLDQTAGNASTGGGNWMFVGTAGGTGSYNLANTSAAGGTLTGFGLGSGNLNVAGRLYLGGRDTAGGGSGTLNVNTSGTIKIGNDLAVGSAGGTGVMNVDAGAITTGGWNFIGKNEGGSGANGTLNLSGGSISNPGRTYVGQDGSTGALNLTGGSYKNVNNEVFSFGDGPGANGTLSITNSASLLQCGGELWFGQNGGTGGMVMSAGAITVNNWVAVGRDNGTGTINLTGGSITKTGGGNFIVGASGPGTLTQSGGLVDVQGGITWIAERNSAVATFTLSGTGEYRTSQMVLGVQGGTNSTVNLNGGTLRLGQLVGGPGTDAVNFNGTQIIATATQANFITSVDTATLAAGGLLVDTNGFNIASSQLFSGLGGVTKSGTGTLSLTGPNEYTGPTAISAGKLVLSSDNANAGNVTVANGTTLGVLQTVQDASLGKTNVTFGTTGATNLDLDLGNFPGNSVNPVLVVTGTARLNGNVTINIADQLPEVGSFPLVSYGTKTGSSAFVLGTRPNGVVASLSESGGVVYLNITSVALPYWDGTVDNIWTTNPTPKNWINLVGGAAASFANGNPALFNDLATGGGGTNVLLNSTVNPGGVTFDNSTLTYSLSGSGKITGTGALVKTGTSAISIDTVNDYTGVTSLNGGTTTVSLLSNGGAASSLGAASSSPANLVLGGGTLDYTGPSRTIDRGYSLPGGTSGLRITNDLTLTGTVSAAGGSIVKTGPGTLTYTNPGANAFGAPGQVARIDEGTVTLSGSSTQTFTAGEIWIGTIPDVPANLILNNTSLTTASWVALGRGNGASGTLSTITATNSILKTANFSTGFNAGRPNNSDQSLILTNTNWTNNGATLLAESANATTDVIIGGTSTVQLNDRLQLGLGADSVAHVTIQDSGSLTKTGGWLAIGNNSNGTGTLTVKNNGVLVADGDFNIGDVDTSNGVLTLQDNAAASSSGIAFIGKNTGTNGTLLQSGGTFNGNNWVTVGRFVGATGTVNVSGGTFNQTGAGQNLIIGEEGTGTLTVSGTGAVNAAGNLVISNAATGVGTVNLNGGTLTTRQVTEGAGGAGDGRINFDGGLLKAGAGANAAFLTGLNQANILAGGLKIDTNGNNISIGQDLVGASATGGLTKSGTGTLSLTGTNTYTGNTTVTGGILSIASTFLADTSTLTIGLTAGSPAVVDLPNDGTDIVAALVIDGVSQPAGLYESTNSGGAITGPGKIQVTAAAAAYSSWIAGFFPGETNPAIIGAGADPDGDGQPNSLEFALGGAPNSGSNNAKTTWLTADSSADGDASPELLLTIAVRTGTPAFTGSPSPSATRDGFTVTVEGSNDLTSFPVIVDPVTAVTTGQPAAPAGYEYRSFSLRGSNGLPTRGYLRVKVTP